MSLYIVKADITNRDVDAIVCTANTNLHLGGLIGKKIIAKAGKTILAELNQIGHCDVGCSVITRGYGLKARNVILRMSDVSDVVCIARDCDKVTLNRMQSEYRSILSLCKIFLLNDLPGYTMDTKESFCFLFPMPLLFEGFIGGFLKSILDGKGRVELQKSDQPLINDIRYAGKSYGPAFMMRHDILCTIEDKVFLMDTKYKKIQRFEDAKEDETLWKMQLIRGVTQQDLYQVSTFAAKRNLKKAYIIYPLLRYEDVESDMPIFQELILTGNSSLDDIKFVDVVLVRVPFVFEEDIDKTKEMLTSTLLKIFE